MTNDGMVCGQSALIPRVATTNVAHPGIIALPVGRDNSALSKVLRCLRFVVTGDFNELIVNTEEEKGRNPLANEKRQVVFAGDLKAERYCHSPYGCPKVGVRRDLGSLLFYRCGKRPFFVFTATVCPLGG